MNALIMVLWPAYCLCLINAKEFTFHTFNIDIPTEGIFRFYKMHFHNKSTKINLAENKVLVGNISTSLMADVTLEKLPTIQYYESIHMQTCSPFRTDFFSGWIGLIKK